MNLKVKDVDVNAVVKLMKELFQPARVTLEGTITDTGDRIEVRSELIWKNQVLDGWLTSRAKPEANDAAKTSKVLNELYDDLLFQMIYDIPRKKLYWSPKSSGDNDLPNWQTQEAMTLGLESLENYQESLEYDDLQRSLHYLERIPIHAPDYALGHYFLAMALGEDRQEERAASVFAQIQGMPADTQLKWAAIFQEAAARLRQYHGPAATYAAEQLLIPLIGELQGVAVNGGETSGFARRLLPLAQAQLGYTYGTLFTLNPYEPREPSETEEEDRKTQLEKNATKAWGDATKAYEAISDWNSEQQRDVLSWLKNTEGYSRYRIAQWKLERKDGRSESDKKRAFTEACNEALKLLDKANQARPNQYEALQNKAMILDDIRFDPKGERINEAESLYQRTAKFVPRDYYQYERLARLYWRRVREQPVSTLQMDQIARGMENVKTAQSYRPESRTAALCGTYFSIAAASNEPDAAKKAQDVHDAILQAKLAFRLSASKAPERKPIATDTTKLIREVEATLDDNDTNKKVLHDLAQQFSK
jgi:hypothetical protein